MIKGLGLLVLLVSAHSAFACMGEGNFRICTGDTVYKGSTYSRGAVVVGENASRYILTVQSLRNGEVLREHMPDLYVARGCLGAVCVGETVYQGAKYSRGAVVLGLNPYRITATVQSLSNGELFEEDPRNLDGSER